MALHYWIAAIGSRRNWLGLVVGCSVLLFSIPLSEAVTQALWVFPSAARPNPVTDAAARQALVSTAAASGVGLLYVSVYSSDPNSVGRYMYDEATITDLLSKVHAAGMKGYAAYGAPDWPTFGCDPNGFPLQRIAEIGAYNTAHPAARFDGVVLDVEPPEPQNTAAYQSLLGQYQCIRNALPAEVDLAVAIRFFWDDAVSYPALSGATKPVFAHVIDMNLRNVVVMGYRDFAGPSDCSKDGLICLDQDEIAYAQSIGKVDLVLAGLETSDPATTGITNKETFFEEGQGAMNLQAQMTLDHFGIRNGLGGFAVHNYQNSYLSGVAAGWPQSNAGFPIVSREVRVTEMSRASNGPLRIQGVGVPNRTYQVEWSSTLAPNSFIVLDSATTNASGVIDYQDATATGETRRFYRLTFP